MDDLIMTTGVSTRILTMPSFMDNSATGEVDQERGQILFADLRRLEVAELRHPRYCEHRRKVAARFLLDGAERRSGARTPRPVLQ
jgi:hypothetical protein